MLNDDRANWGPAYALFTGDVAYVWHGRPARRCRGCRTGGLRQRAQIVGVKQHHALSRGHYHWRHENCWYAVRAFEGRFGSARSSGSGSLSMAAEGDGRTRIPADEDVRQRSGVGEIRRARGQGGRWWDGTPYPTDLRTLATKYWHNGGEVGSRTQLQRPLFER